jgi:hypothetical protein
MATPILPWPTADDVIRAEKKFDQENGPTEWLLRQLFEKFPENTNLGEVLVKTKVLNVLYSVRAGAVDAVAKRIINLGMTTRSLSAGWTPFGISTALCHSPISNSASFFFGATHCCRAGSAAGHKPGTPC